MNSTYVFPTTANGLNCPSSRRWLSNTPGSLVYDSLPFRTLKEASQALLDNYEGVVSLRPISSYRQKTRDLNLEVLFKTPEQRIAALNKLLKSTYGKVCWSYPTLGPSGKEYVMMRLHHLPLDDPDNLKRIFMNNCTQVCRDWEQLYPADPRIIDVFPRINEQTGFYDGSATIVLHAVTGKLPIDLLYVKSYGVQCAHEEQYEYAYCRNCQIFNSHEEQDCPYISSRPKEYR